MAFLKQKTIDYAKRRFRLENSRIITRKCSSFVCSNCAERVQRMEDTGVITGYNAQVDPSKLGWSLAAMIMMSVNRINFQSFTDSMDQYPEMATCTRVTGKDCLIMKFYLKDSKHLEEVINRLTQHGEPTTLLILNELKESSIIRKCF